MSGLRQRGPGHVAPSWLLAAPLLTVGVACIANDDLIQRDEKLNDSPVRFLEPVVTTLDTRCDCSDALAPKGDEDRCPDDEPSNTWDPISCLQPTPSGIPHLMLPEDFPFCACPTGEVDADPPQVAGIELSVEDQDKDIIYPAVFVDLESPGLAPRVDLELFLLDNYSPEQLSSTPASLAALKQEARHVRNLVITDLSEGLFDPCNDGGLEPGWHELTILVTDRPFAGLRQNFGSPDFASGATVDTTHYSFFCQEPDVAPCDTRCQPVSDG